MILDTGYRCHEFAHLGLLPFAICDDVNLLYNQSGYSGPKESIRETNAAISGFSGVLGPGTPYPTSGAIDQILRQFWSVKSWILTVDLARVMDATWEDCPLAIQTPSSPFPLIWRFYNYCSLGQYAGESSSLPPPMTMVSKTLTMQDYCSSQAVSGNRDRRGVCPYSEYSGSNPNKQTCCATNPIQKFNDLLCRKTYASWTPSNADWDKFPTGDLYSMYNTNPYVDKSTQFRVLSNPELMGMYTCKDALYYDDVFSMFSLSIMDYHNFLHSGSCNAPTTGHYPELYPQKAPTDCLGLSGEVLASSNGDITGYGINLKPSGIDIPLLFDIGTGVAESFKPNDSRNYFPLINFKMQLRTPVTAVGGAYICPVKDTISSIRTRAGQKSVGELIIRDYISGSAVNDSALSQMKVPLFATNTADPCNYLVTATLQPVSFWVKSDLQENY